MPYINEIYRFNYAADNLTTGLGDVVCYILDCTNVLSGPFNMTETALAGIYVYEYTPVISGQYVFTGDSTSYPKKLILTVNFDEAGSGGGSGGPAVPVAQFDE